jgi:CheY-like chemotaxis protein
MQTASLPEDDPGLDPRVVKLIASYLPSERSVAEILKLSPYPAFETERTLAGLVHRGALKMRDSRQAKTVMMGSAELAHVDRRTCIIVLSELPTYGESIAAALNRAGMIASAIDPEVDPSVLAGMNPDGILLDLVDSDNGLERCRRLAQPSAAPVIVLASNPAREAILQTVNAGAREVFIKPLAMDDLVSKLQRLFPH